MLLAVVPISVMDFSVLVKSNYPGWSAERFEQLTQFALNYKGLFIPVFVIAAYLLGHVIKVFSKVQYDLLEGFLDKGLWRLGAWLLTKMPSWPSEAKWLKHAAPFKVVREFLQEVFSFQRMNYRPEMEPMYQRVKTLISEKLDHEFTADWHGFYKFADAIAQQEGLPSKTYTFLAKYNFYRSLAFLFLLNFFYIWWVNSNYGTALPTHFVRVAIVANFLFWFSFHEKYKRYWQLCGNESIAMAYYFLSKPQKSDAKTVLTRPRRHHRP